MSEYLIEYTLNEKQQENLVDQYEYELKKNRRSVVYSAIIPSQFNEILRMTYDRWCRDFKKNDDGVYELIMLNWKLALQSGHDYKLYYSILSGSTYEELDGGPILIGYENKDGIFWNIECVY